MKERMENYGRKSEFSSFLPGIAGIKGIPIWCYYVNRGQGVCSFGVDNKDHAIMEFFPAHTAYEMVKTNGFRTFIKKNDVYTEPFADEEKQHVMEIMKNTMSICETDEANGIQTDVTYFILPEENVGALVRKLTITNLGEDADFEVIDGMPAVICYGVGNDSMKNMLQTTKAWMQVEDTETNIPYYRVRASMNDSAEVTEVLGGNFAFATDEEGNLKIPIVDADAVFDYDKSLRKPVRFVKEGLAAVLSYEQIHSNLLPMAMFAEKKHLKTNESMVLYELIGQVEEKSYLQQFLAARHDGAYYEKKYARANELAEELCAGIETKTGNERFDAYCSYTYMDNVLRGGYPIKLGNNKIFYVYSRKHGDLERDYNYFSMAPEFFSQGNGNFRDVNQNRRCDTFFAPYVGRENIRMFYSLIQLDGYNPLSIEKLIYELKEEQAKNLLGSVDQACELIKLVTEGFTPGKLYRALQKYVAPDRVEELFYALMDFATEKSRAVFGEGYWCDHWTYNLDLVEEYLNLFPEKEEEMLFEKAYTFFLSQANINDRSKRYAVTPKGIRQYYSLNQKSLRNTEDKRLHAAFGKGDLIYTTLLEKLILLCATKFATLDAYGMGIEMEGGKPGWYDALNGAPGMLGSSMAETYELARMLDYTISALKKFPRKITLLKEVADFVSELNIINDMERPQIETKQELLAFWNKINDAKEAYRNQTYEGISGDVSQVDSKEVLDALEGFRNTVDYGIRKAIGYGDGICPTYFTYDVTDYEQNEDGIFPMGFAVQTVPYFLEGPVRFLKLKEDETILPKKILYRNVKASDVFDRKLHMYKVNASLESASYELGRTRAFTPGWLENESVFLHMEYKYLLETLKSGLYEEFFDDFHRMAIPFLDPDMYGRSTLENSSFLASSKNPNQKIHGKGFVARLSGSTVEFISMWKRMMFGEKPFVLKDGQLTAQLTPSIPAYLIGDDNTVSATFLGKTKVTYQFAEQKDYIPGKYEIVETVLNYQDGTSETISGGQIPEKCAKALRNGDVCQICQKIK